jgi:hypothetical protein
MAPAGADDVVALQQATEAAGAGRKAAKDERAVAAGFVARRADGSAQAADGSAGPDHFEGPVIKEFKSAFGL